MLAGWFPQITCRRHEIFRDDGRITTRSYNTSIPGLKGYTSVKTTPILQR